MTDANRPELADLGVVICAYSDERFDDILEAVESVLNQVGCKLELVVVVDHNPGLLARLRDCLHPRVRLVENQNQPGLSGARNTGAQAISAPLIAFLDDDAVAEPESLATLAGRCREDGALGAGAHISPLWRGSQPRWFPDSFLWTLGCTYEGLAPGPVRNLIGACMVMHRDVLISAGGFAVRLGRTRASLPYGCEETELCIRASRLAPGGRFVYEPASRVGHKVTAARMTWRYFVLRCFSEGVSKATMRMLVQDESALSSEMSYVSKILPRACLVALKDVFVRRDGWGLGRCAAIVLGLSATSSGYLWTRAKLFFRPGAPSSPLGVPA